MDQPDGKTYNKLTVGKPIEWLRFGWRRFVRVPGISLGYAAVFAAIGAAGSYLFLDAGFTPMIYPWAGAFMLVAPPALSGFFNVAKLLEQGRSPRLGDFFAGFGNSPPSLWIIALLTSFLGLIWLTDAGVIYTIFFGTAPLFMSFDVLQQGEIQENLATYLVFCTLIGAVLAYIIFAVTAFSVPLIFYRRQGFTRAVWTSIQAVTGNFVPMILWGFIMSVGIIGSLVLLPPVFLLVFPVLAFASERAYRDTII